MSTLERKLEKKHLRKDSEGAVLGKRVRITKRLWDDDEDDLPAAVAVSGTKVSSFLWLHFGK